MIQACIGQSIVPQFCQSIVSGREVVGQSSVMGQELRLDVHAIGMRSVELERSFDQVVIPPHQLKIALQQMQQVKVLRDSVVERYFVGVIKASTLRLRRKSFLDRKTRSIRGSSSAIRFSADRSSA